MDPEYLFSPIKGEGKNERLIVENYFKVNYTHRFNVGRITRPGKFFFSIFIFKLRRTKKINKKCVTLKK